MSGHPFRFHFFLAGVFLLAFLLPSQSGLAEKRIKKISIKATAGGPNGFWLVEYDQQGSEIKLEASGEGHSKIDDLLAEAVATDTVFLNMYTEILQMIAYGTTKNVMVDVHLRSHATAQWHWRDKGNFEIVLHIRKK